MAQGDVLNMSLDDIIKQKGSGPRKQDRKKVELLSRIRCFQDIGVL